MPNCRYLLRLLSLVIATLVLAEGPAEANTTCTFHFKGKLTTTRRWAADLWSGTELTAQVPLVGVPVRVSASQKYGTWNDWKTEQTDSTGAFDVDVTRSGGECDGRYIRVELKFEDARLKLEPTDWRTLVNTKDDGYQVASGSTSFGTFAFSDPGQAAADSETEEWLRWSHAGMWVFYQDMLAYFDSLGTSYAFRDQLQVKYPVNSVVGNASESSYSSPSTGNIHIVKTPVRDQYSAGTFAHEAMHTWVYDHFHGDTGLTSEILLGDHSTHDVQEDPYIAFHEGFAEFAGRQVLKAVYDYGTSSLLPYSRPYLCDEIGVCESSEFERSDYGWTSALRTLLQPNIWTYDFGWLEYTSVVTYPVCAKYGVKGYCDPSPIVTWQYVFHYPPGGPLSASRADPNALSDLFAVECDVAEPWSVSFIDVLSVFLPKASAGYPQYLSKSELSFDGFFARAAAVLPNVDSAQAAALQTIIDPRETRQPYEILACHPKIIFLPF